jgi:type I restriction enzyme S subunit
MNGQLPKEWTESILRNCVDILDNQRVPVNSNERAKRLGTVPYYGATGLVGYIDDFLFNEELLLIGEDGAPFLDKSKPIAYLIQGKSWVNNHAHILRAKPGVTSNQYLKYFFDSFNFSGYVNGTTRLKLTQAAMTHIPVRLSPLGEQRRIVVKLEQLLGRVGSSQKRLELVPGILKRFRQSVLAAACSGHLTADWRKGNTADTKDIDNGLPVGWQDTLVGDVIEELKYGTSQKCSYEKRGVPVLRIPNVSDGIVTHSDLKYAVLPEKEFQQLRLRTGDILLIRSNGSVSLVGKCALVRDTDQDFAYAGYLIRLRPNAQTVVPEFLNLALESYGVRAQIEIPARSTSGVNNINSTEVRALRFLLPPLPEQREICRRVEALSKIADRIDLRYQEGKRRVDSLTQSILAKAFHGDLVPQDPKDEPASALLARIARQTNGHEADHSRKTAKRTK